MGIRGGSEGQGEAAVGPHPPPATGAGLEVQGAHEGHRDRIGMGRMRSQDGAQGAAAGPHPPPAAGAGLEVRGLWGYVGVRGLG